MQPDAATTLRAALIAQLEREGALHDDAVRAAMLAVPRHCFLPNEPLERAYANDAIATKFADGISISSASQPAIVALMLEQLALAPGMKVLEIGAGTGYNAALMSALVGPGGQVTTVDIDADITDAAREHLTAIGISDVAVITADGAAGYPPNAPYDRVILTVNAGDIAPTWAAQLKPGGLLVLPLSVGAAQFSIAFEKRDGILRSLSMQPCSFMPLRGSMGGDGTGSRAINPRPSLRLTMTNIAASNADAIAVLLESAPTPHVIPGVRQGWFTALAFALSEPDGRFVSAFITSDDVRYGFVGHGYGIFDLAAGGGAVIRLSDAMDGTADMTTLAYGNPTTGAWLAAVLTRWEQQGAPRPQDYTVTAFPDGESITPPAGASVIALPHWRLVFEIGNA
jgi:protein-L-isoaspartate(D-aspartate) O-methyltransferase